MPSALSVDLRTRVVAAIEAGASRRQAATGASDDVLQVVRNNPRHIADIAAEALKIADPTRHIQRLQAIRRARGGRDPTD